MASVIALGVVISLIQPFCAKLTERVIDDLQKGASERFFITLPLILIAAFLVSGVAKFFYNSVRRTVSQEVVCSLRSRLFEKFVHFPLEKLQGTRSGEMLSTIQNDLVQVDAGAETFCDLIKEPVAFIGLMGVAFYANWKLALATLVVAPVVAWLFAATGQAVKRYSVRCLMRFSELITLSQESLVGAHIVKVFGLEKTLIEKFQAIQEEYFRTLRKSIRVQEMNVPVVELIGALLMAGVLAYGGYQISLGLMTAGQLIAFVVAIGLAQMPVKQLNSAFIRMRIAQAAAERIYTFLGADVPVVANQSNALAFNDRIEFRSVGLHYGDKRALDQINLEVKRGECVAFVGFSGSGKSSIVNLLPRLYEASEGEILIDGKSTKFYSLDDLRSLFSFVTQETFLFNDSIYENIRYGKPSATKEEIERAAEQAHCLSFISRFPEGFERKVGERGMQLSGGERQRVAIARAILKGAPILVLDEATSSLDSASEAIVQKALESLMQGRTIFLVAHRFSTVRKANRIYVIEGGKLKEAGTHQDLLSKQGVYTQLFTHQTAPGVV